MGGGLRGLEAAALVDRNVDDHSAALHAAQHVAGHELGSGSTRNENRTDDDIGREYFLFQRFNGRIPGVDATVEDVVQFTETRDRAVEDCHVRAKADGHLGGIETNHAAADDGDLARQHARHAAEQHATAAIGLLERGRTGLNRQTSGHFRHRCKKRQAAARIGHGFVGHAGST